MGHHSGGNNNTQQKDASDKQASYLQAHIAEAKAPALVEFLQLSSSHGAKNISRDQTVAVKELFIY